MTLDDWISRHGLVPRGLRYDPGTKQYYLVAEIPVPKRVAVGPEDEDRLGAEERKHLLLPGVR